MILSSKRGPWDVKGLAIVLGVSARSVYRAVQANRIPYFKFGASIKFDPVAVYKWFTNRASIPR